MYSDIEVFVWRFESLRDLIENPNDGNLLSASAILRLMLIDDGNPLILKVAKGRDFSPVFVVRDKPTLKTKQLEAGEHSFQIGHISPQSDSDTVKRLKLNEFLALKVIGLDDAHISVHEILSYVANVGGGIHKGSPKFKHNAREIHAYSGRIGFLGHPYPVEMVRQIGEITLVALSPLYHRLRV